MQTAPKSKLLVAGLSEGWMNAEFGKLDGYRIVSHDRQTSVIAGDPAGLIHFLAQQCEPRVETQAELLPFTAEATQQRLDQRAADGWLCRFCFIDSQGGSKTAIFEKPL